MATTQQLTTCSVWAYANAYLEQRDGVWTMSRDEVIDNLNALYGLGDCTEDSDLYDLRVELYCSLEMDWGALSDTALFLEVQRQRRQREREAANEHAEYAGEWQRALDAADAPQYRPGVRLTAEAPDRASDDPNTPPALTPRQAQYVPF